MPGNRCTPEQICEIRERRIKTRSHYKMTCGCCGETIHRGDEITQVLGNVGEMRPRRMFCRYVGGAESSYDYAPTRNRWVHLHCRPSHWYTHGWSPMFCAGFTRYSESIDSRQQAACMDPDWGENYWEIPRPVWKLEQERIEKGVVATFQALWRGYATRKRNLTSPRFEMPHFPIGMEVSVVFNKTKNSKGKVWTGRIISGVYAAPRLAQVGWTGRGYIPRWYVVKFDADGEIRMYQHNHLEMLIEEAEEWKKDRSWTRTRDGISLDSWYSIQADIFKKRFPHTGHIMSRDKIDHPQWLHFCKPYKPQYHPSHRPQFGEVAAQIAACIRS